MCPTVLEHYKPTTQNIKLSRGAFLHVAKYSCRISTNARAYVVGRFLKAATKWAVHMPASLGSSATIFIPSCSPTHTFW